ncbi:hypothetical protein EPO05_06155 [Patescibacteria group bacterium]|nr:MAG: hypothetical protein EPO05_06155 [Patescibacteria group bacterium]
MTPEQQQLLQSMIGEGTTAPQLQAAQNQLQQLTQGPIGSSPATQAGMEAFQQLTLPSIMQTAALQGNAAGGAAIEGAQQGASAAALPLIQQEIQNREAAVGQYGGLQQAQMQALAQAFEASGLPREVALEQAQAAYDKAQQAFGIESGVQMLPLQMLGDFLGKSQKSHTTLGAWDYVAGIGKGLQGPAANLFGGGGNGGG